MYIQSSKTQYHTVYWQAPHSSKGTSTTVYAVRNMCVPNHNRKVRTHCYIAHLGQTPTHASYYAPSIAPPPPCGRKTGITWGIRKSARNDGTFTRLLLRMRLTFFVAKNCASGIIVRGCLRGLDLSVRADTYPRCNR